jgi:hypothetical protein
MLAARMLLALEMNELDAWKERTMRYYFGKKIEIFNDGGLALGSLIK